MTEPGGAAPGSSGRVILDAQAVQSADHHDRGIARYAAGFATALVHHHPELVAGVVVDGSRPVPPSMEPFTEAGLLAGSREQLGRLLQGLDPAGGAVYHVLSPYELDLRLDQVWPRVAWEHRARLAVTVYDVIPEVFPEVYLADGGRRQRYRARHQLVRAADVVLTMSLSAAADVAERLGIDPGRITVVGGAVDERFRPAASADTALGVARREVPSLGERCVVYNGAVEPRKNMDRLVQAFARVPAESRAGWQLVLVCRLDEGSRHHYRVMADHLGLGDALVLTGYVSDETLVALYQGAAGAGLVAMPSLYEGYGLPVAEAMACGAPVVASRTSSLLELAHPEGCFNPQDVVSISEVLARAMTDPALRERLVQWSVSMQRRLSWKAVADAAADAYRAQLAAPARRRSRVRPRLALFTPWPPAPSGVADYSARLVEAMGDKVTVDVLVDGTEGRPDLQPAHPGETLDGESGDGDGKRAAGGGRRLAGGGRLGDGRRLAVEARFLPLLQRLVGPHDGLLCCLGNSEFHVEALRTLLAGPAAAADVLAHEVRLTGLWYHATARGAVAGRYDELLHRLHPKLFPEPAGSPGRRDGDDGVLSDRDASRLGVLMIEPVMEAARHVLTTSEAAANLVRGAIGSTDAMAGDRVRSVGFAFPPVVERDQNGIEAGLVCSFGVVGEAKCPDVVVRAFAAAAGGRDGTRLVFVGPSSESERDALHLLAQELGVEERISFTGYVPRDTYDGYLRRAAVAVQLRAWTNGESSAATADCLAHGIATIVTDLGAASDLPAEAVVKVPVERDGARVGAALAALLDDPEHRRSLGRAGQRHAAANGFPTAAERLLSALAL